MESTLHAALKARLAGGQGDRLEVTVDGFRIDAIALDGSLIEVQSGALGPLREKLVRLLPRYHMRIVKPLIAGRRIMRQTRGGRAIGSPRWSPKRATMIDFFDDLVGLARLFPHPNLEVEVLGVTIDEVRVPRRRRPGFRVVDRHLIEIKNSRTLRHAADLWSLLPLGLCDPFTTADLALHLPRPIDFAQRVAYCLRLTGAARVIGKRGNRLVYCREREYQERTGAMLGA
jgi:hypothetical protein